LTIVFSSAQLRDILFLQEWRKDCALSWWWWWWWRWWWWHRVSYYFLLLWVTTTSTWMT